MDIRDYLIYENKKIISTTIDSVKHFKRSDCKVRTPAEEVIFNTLSNCEEYLLVTSGYKGVVVIKKNSGAVDRDIEKCEKELRKIVICTTKKSIFQLDPEIFNQYLNGI